MHSEQVQTVEARDTLMLAAEVEAAGEGGDGPDAAPRVTMASRLRAALRACGRVFAGNGHAVATHDSGGLACAEDGAQAMTGERSVTQINDSDRAFLNAFPLQRKTQVLETIMSLTPVQTLVREGYSPFEKAMMTLHRDGYGLIDMQPQENAFTTVWYRKNASLLGKGADVTMLVWEERERGGAVTLMSWRI